MKIKNVFFISFMFLLFVGAGFPRPHDNKANYCFAQVISSSELINNAKDYDGKNIVFEGEAIGNLMNRGNFYWLNISRNDSAIGVWLPKALASRVKFTGGYKIKGDWLRIEGIFHRACIEHGGDLDIHAAKLVVLNQGQYQKEVIPLGKKKLALYLGGISLCLLMWQVYLSRQKRKLKIAQT